MIRGGGCIRQTIEQKLKPHLRMPGERLALRASSLPALQKGKQAIALTMRGPVILTAVKLLSREVKRHGWQNRSMPAKLGLSTAAVGVVVFGGQGAGIAAVGTAIGVPLWVVLGSGAALAGVIIEEFGRNGGRPNR
jgi:hypothetical protein